MTGRLMAHLETCRPYTLFYTGLVSLGGAALAGGQGHPWRLAGAWAAPTLGWVAGLYAVDYFDRELDAIAKPHRPIPSGRLSPRAALALMWANIAAGAAIAVLLDPWTILPVAVIVACGAGYSAVFKKRGTGGHVVRGGLTASAFVFGTMAVGHGTSWRLMACAAVFWAHDAGSNVIGALRDIDGDRASGHETVPIRYGAKPALRVAAVFWLLWCAAGAVCLHSLDADFFAGCLLVLAAVQGLVALAKVAEAGADRLREAALGAYEVLVLERLVLASAFLAAGFGALPALALLVAATLATLFSQVTMRRRFEFGAARHAAGRPGAPEPSAGLRTPARSGHRSARTPEKE